MIGRGTRLCKDLFGPGQDKTRFMIFDHGGNFEFFEEKYKPAEGGSAKALLERVFEARLNLADQALEAGNQTAFTKAIELIGRDVRALPEKSIAIRDKWQQVKHAGSNETLQNFDQCQLSPL